MTKPEVKEVVRSLLPFILLKIAETKPFHGYELITILRKQFKVYLGPSIIYPLLHSMEEEGLLTAEWTMGKYKHPVRIYRVTAEGLETKEILGTTLETTIQMISRGIVLEPLKLPKR